MEYNTGLMGMEDGKMLEWDFLCKEFEGKHI